MENLISPSDYFRSSGCAIGGSPHLKVRAGIDPLDVKREQELGMIRHVDYFDSVRCEGFHLQNQMVRMVQSGRVGIMRLTHNANTRPGWIRPIFGRAPLRNVQVLVMSLSFRE